MTEQAAPQPPGQDPAAYLRWNVLISAVINGVANGLIAFFAYRQKAGIPASDAGIDILITVAIISWLTSWLVIGGTRKDIRTGKVIWPSKPESDPKRPLPASVRALLIMVACTAVFGGLLGGIVTMALPAGFSNWGYIIFKIFYTAASGALAVIISIKSVYRESGQRQLNQ